jgi:lipopolysaccharide export system protein LptA
MRKRISAMPKYIVSGLVISGLTSWCGVLNFVPATAQNRAAAPATAPAQFGALRQIIRANGIRLEGNAFVRRPELQVNADAIALDYSATAKTIGEVRARGKVFFRVNLPPRGGGAPAQIEARCNAADLNPNTRTLVLTGNVNGFYQVQGGPRNLLTGDKVTLTYVGNQLTASSVGKVRVVLPAENFSAGSSGTASTAIGAVTITANRADVNGATGVVTFSGAARAVSTEGPKKFDVSAPTFTLARGQSGTIDTLKTVGGRARVRIDLPPDPVRADGATAERDNGSGVGRPTQVEAESDSVTVTRANNTVVFEGKVNGTYRLQPAGQQATDYPFTGDRAIIRYVTDAQANANTPAGFQAEILGAPSSIGAPDFNLGF